MQLVERGPQERIGVGTVSMEAVEALQRIPSSRWRLFKEEVLRQSAFDGLRVHTVEGVAVDLPSENGVVTLKLERRTPPHAVDQLKLSESQYYVKATRGDVVIEVGVQQATKKERKEFPETVEGRAVRAVFLPFFEGLLKFCKEQGKDEEAVRKSALAEDLSTALDEAGRG